MFTVSIWEGGGGKGLLVIGLNSLIASNIPHRNDLHAVSSGNHLR